MSLERRMPLPEVGADGRSAGEASRWGGNQRRLVSVAAGAGELRDKTIPAASQGEGQTSRTTEDKLQQQAVGSRVQVTQ